MGQGEYVTDKRERQERTLEEKVQRLLELTKHYDVGPTESEARDRWLAGWLRAPNDYNDREHMLSNEDHMPPGFVSTTWDVHSGLAFTKLYRALK